MSNNESEIRTIEDQYKHDDKGRWKPREGAHFEAVFQLPVRPLAILKWLFRWGGYLYPLNASWLLLSVAIAAFFVPPMSVMATWSAGWIVQVLLRNFIVTYAVYGGLYLLLNVIKILGSKQKYSREFTYKNSNFWFKNQLADNMLRVTLFAIPIWTAFDVIYYSAAARGLVPLVTWQSNPVWFVAWFLLIPIWRELHFFFIHRLIHWGPLFRFHKQHHYNHEVISWSGMSMHPVELLLYLSELLIHFAVPSSLYHFVFNSIHVAMSPAQGHIGFNGPIYKMQIGSYFHYLHHRHVTCNFGEVNLPLDRWYGSFFNGEGKYQKKASASLPGSTSGE